MLTQQGLSPASHYACLGLYILGYIVDDSVMVGVVVMALGSNKLGERGGRLLKLLSGAVMLALGVVLLLRPQWLLLDCCAGRCSLARFVGSASTG